MLPTLHATSTDKAIRLEVAGAWRLSTFNQLIPLDSPAAILPVEVDGSAITYLDTSGAWALLRALHDGGLAPDTATFSGFSTEHLAILDLVKQNFDASLISNRHRQHSALAGLGKLATTGWQRAHGLLAFIGVLSTEFMQLLRYPQRFRTKEFTNQIEVILVYAIPLAFAMMFLLGLVFSYLLGIQAKQYGANIFVVDGAALAVCRELAPVIVAILVAGRSGAAITAQLGTMKVYEEIDAISVLGLSPYAVLVIPRILALIIALPLLVFVGDVAGLLGSMLVAAQQLDITPASFMSRLDQVLEIKTVLIGLLKAPVFAAFIGVIACYMGFNVARDARSIGLNTTATVVESIVSVILLNAIFAILLVKLGI
ncbi:MlaE family ABC transporter permease [Sulfuriferula nivalis]|uniref:Sulfate transporter n=1 Tax=Sulfuriferula nivalis TaxID=2675298 RepID=A0A809S798_9PROT|nr:ABC transporter permease [Sulfuriferula nivalis]BBO99391.1 sulfate transporter [Sulfuriferula nivalis]